MTVPNKISNHTDQSYDLLLGQFKEKPVIQAILKTWTDKTQEVENDLYDLMTKTLFLVAEGENLQRYGTLLGVLRPEGLADGAYRELLIAEILRRSSDGTPDRIRQILEATTGMFNMKIFEHIGENQLPITTESLMVYGYAAPDITSFTIDGDEGKYLKWAAPASTGSCTIGQHTYGESTLFIPSELVSELQRLRVDVEGDPSLVPDFIVTNNQDYIAVQANDFEQYGEGYENGILPEFGYSNESYQIDYAGTGIEDFAVDDETLGIVDLYVDTTGSIQATSGIMLETAQITFY